MKLPADYYRGTVDHIKSNLSNPILMEFNVQVGGVSDNELKKLADYYGFHLFFDTRNEIYIFRRKTHNLIPADKFMRMLK